jgi:hypothetical protein
MGIRAVMAAGVVAAAIPGAAAAQGAEPPPVEARWSVDGAITAAALGGTLLLRLVDVDTTRTWDHELFGSLDASLRGRSSAGAAALSDALLGTALALPVVADAARGVDDGSDDRMLVYGEALAITGAVTQLVKYAVQRPRPAAYRGDRADPDSRLSLFSGHAALAFAAAMTGGYLHAASDADPTSRAAIWFAGTAVASATATLRVEAGAHFYSDVVIGAVVGAAIGLGVPRLHHDGIDLGLADWLAIGNGVVVGALTAHLLDLPQDAPRLELRPMITEGGAGVAIGGRLR